MHFYLGSCRYMHIFSNFCPIRLHSTHDILFILQNLSYLSSLRDTLPRPMFYNGRKNFLKRGWSDVCCHFIANKVPMLLSHSNEITDVYVELSSRKQYYFNTKIPIVHFYVSERAKRRFNLQEHTLTDAEMAQHITSLQETISTIFNPSCSLHIITHLDLKSSKLNSLIPSRHSFVNYLVSFCKEHNIHCITPHVIFTGLFIEDVLSDGRHFYPNSLKIIAKHFEHQLETVPYTHLEIL